MSLDHFGVQKPNINADTYSILSCLFITLSNTLHTAKHIAKMCRLYMGNMVVSMLYLEYNWIFKQNIPDQVIYLPTTFLSQHTDLRKGSIMMCCHRKHKTNFVNMNQ